MTLPPAWLFALSGSVLAVGSAIAGGIITLRLEHREKHLEREIAENKVDERQRHHFEGLVFYNFAQLKVFFSNFVKGTLGDGLLEQAYAAIVMAIDSRNKAADFPLKGDALIEIVQSRDFDRIFFEWDRLMEEYSNRYNDMVNKKASLTESLTDTRRSVARSRWVAISLQIIGAIIVMCKDLPMVQPCLTK
jgi:hypothetical protein